MTTTHLFPPLLAEFCAVDRPSGSIWLNGPAGEAHCVPFSHLTSNVLAERWTSPIFRPPLCTDIPANRLSLTPKGPPGAPCTQCYTILSNGHWPRCPEWPVSDDVVEDGLALYSAIWGVSGIPDAETIRHQQRVLRYLTAVHSGVATQVALKASGARSFVALARHADAIGMLEEMLATLPSSKLVRSVRSGLLVGTRNDRSTS